MIGADPKPVCELVERETGVKIVPVATSGLKLRTQPEVADWVAKTMITEFGKFSEPDQDAINLIGYSTDPVENPQDLHRTFQGEVSQALKPAGLRVNAQAPIGASLDDWRNLPTAGLSVVIDQVMYDNLLQLLERPGHIVLELPQPYGLAKTDAFYQAIAKATGRPLEEGLAQLDARQAAVEALARAKSKLQASGSLMESAPIYNFRPDDLASEGLGAYLLCWRWGLKSGL